MFKADLIGKIGAVMMLSSLGVGGYGGFQYYTKNHAERGLTYLGAVTSAERGEEHLKKAYTTFKNGLEGKCSTFLECKDKDKIQEIRDVYTQLNGAFIKYSNTLTGYQGKASGSIVTLLKDVSTTGNGMRNWVRKKNEKIPYTSSQFESFVQQGADIKQQLITQLESKGFKKSEQANYANTLSSWKEHNRLFIPGAAILFLVGLLGYATSRFRE